MHIITKIKLCIQQRCHFYPKVGFQSARHAGLILLTNLARTTHAGLVHSGPSAGFSNWVNEKVRRITAIFSMCLKKENVSWHAITIQVHILDKSN